MGVRRLDTRHLSIGGIPKPQLLDLLVDAEVSLNGYARALFDDPKFTTEPSPRLVRVTTVSLPDIGLHHGGTFAEIVAAAAEQRLMLCPLEVAPHLRLSYLDQPVGPYLTVASPEPHPGTESPNGFYLRHCGDGLWLRGYEAGDENVFSPEFSDYVFMQPEDIAAGGTATTARPHPRREETTEC